MLKLLCILLTTPAIILSLRLTLYDLLTPYHKPKPKKYHQLTGWLIYFLWASTTAWLLYFNV